MQKRNVIETVIVVLIVVLAFGGCAKKPPIHPGAINEFDSYAYDTLLTAQAGITEAKTQLASNPSAKEPLNQAISAYNAALATYNLYHATQDPAAQATLQNQLNGVISAVAAVQKSFGRTP